LHSYNMELQLEVRKIEERTNVAIKCRYPFFDEISFYAAIHLTKQLQLKVNQMKSDAFSDEKRENITKWEIMGIPHLVKYCSTKLGEGEEQAAWRSAAESSGFTSSHHVMETLKEVYEKYTSLISSDFKVALCVEKPIDDEEKILAETTKNVDSQESVKKGLKLKMICKTENKKKEEEGIENEVDRHKCSHVEVKCDDERKNAIPMTKKLAKLSQNLLGFIEDDESVAEEWNVGDKLESSSEVSLEEEDEKKGQSFKLSIPKLAFKSSVDVTADPKDDEFSTENMESLKRKVVHVKGPKIPPKPKLSAGKRTLLKKFKI